LAARSRSSGRAPARIAPACIAPAASAERVGAAAAEPRVDGAAVLTRVSGVPAVAEEVIALAAAAGRTENGGHEKEPVPASHHSIEHHVLLLSFARIQRGGAKQFALGARSPKPDTARHRHCNSGARQCGVRACTVL